MASASLDPLPELVDPGDQLLVGADEMGAGKTYPTWKALLDAPVDTILLKPGNYDIGVPTGNNQPTTHPEFGPTQDGSSGRRRVLRALGDTPPLDRTPEDEVRIPGFQFGTFTGLASAYWIIHGVTMRDTAWENSVRNASHHVVLDRLLITGNQTAYGVRVLLRASDVTVQRSAIRDPANLGDGVGVQWKCPSSAQTQGTMHNLRVLSCDLRDYNDAFAITVDGDDVTENGIIFDGGLVDDNDMYLTPAMRTAGDGVGGSGNLYALAENAMDIKGGSADPLNPVRLTNNRMRGYRYFDALGGSSGSDGTAVVVHIQAKNIYLGQSQIWDCPAGIRQHVWREGFPQIDRNIVVEDVLLHGLQRFAPEDRGGMAFVSPMPMICRRNVIAQCESGVRDIASLFGFEFTFEHNVAINAPLALAATPWAAGPGNLQIGSAAAGHARVGHGEILGGATLLAAGWPSSHGSQLRRDFRRSRRGTRHDRVS